MWDVKVGVVLVPGPDTTLRELREEVLPGMRRMLGEVREARVGVSGAVYDLPGFEVRVRLDGDDVELSRTVYLGGRDRARWEAELEAVVGVLRGHGYEVEELPSRGPG